MVIIVRQVCNDIENQADNKTGNKTTFKVIADNEVGDYMFLMSFVLSWLALRWTQISSNRRGVVRRVDRVG